MRKLYFVLWVDDFGRMKLPRKDVRWYHKNAGPISFTIPNDDFYKAKLSEVLPKISKSDFACHHFHPIEGNRNFLGSVLISLGNALGSHFMFKLSSFVSEKQFRKKKSGKGIKIKISDILWMEKFLLRTKEEFEKYGEGFPSIVRHGWGLPPENSMEFYMGRLGVLADASACPKEVERYPEMNGRKLTWIKKTTPYYASLKKDFNVEWNGSEEDRGMLEIPVILSNVSQFGFGEEDKKIIKKLPPGSLVSAYVHPGDGFKEVKKLVRYLKENYNVEFIRADEFVNIYMKKNPRPVCLDENGDAYWAFVEKRELIKIRSTDSIFISGFKKNKDKMSFGMEVKTKKPILLMGLNFKGFFTQAYRMKGRRKIKTLKIGRSRFLRNVKPGKYMVEVKRE